MNVNGCLHNKYDYFLYNIHNFSVISTQNNSPLNNISPLHHYFAAAACLNILVFFILYVQPVHPPSFFRKIFRENLRSAVFHFSHPILLISSDAHKTKQPPTFPKLWSSAACFHILYALKPVYILHQSGNNTVPLLCAVTGFLKLDYPMIFFPVNRPFQCA